LRNLKARNLLGLLGVQFEQAQQTAFAEHNEFAISYNAGTAAVDVRRRRAVGLPSFVAVPHEFAGFEFDAAKMGVRFVAAAEGVKKAVMVDGGVPMEFEDSAAPEFFE
jgi:hypothetical protein